MQLGEQTLGVDTIEDAFGHLRGAQVANPSQDVVQAIPASRTCHLRAALQIVLDAGQGIGVDQLAQLLLPEQLAQQIFVQ